MLAHLRARIIEKLADTNSVILASSGPAGIQISTCPLRSVGLRLYALIPATSEHAVNLEHNSDVAVTADLWRLTDCAWREGSNSPYAEAEARWHQVVEIWPQRFEFLTEDGKQVAETIDIEESDLQMDG